MSRSCVLAALVLLACTTVRADPGYYVVTVYDNEGQKSLDFRYWTVKTQHGPAVLWPEVGFGYGVTSRWYTELYASYIGTMDSAKKLNTWNWQNDYLFTQGDYPVDIALHTNLISYVDKSEGWTLEAGPALQTDIGRTQLNANLFLERSYSTATPSYTELKYQWQARYRWKPNFHVGVQGFGELGKWDHWDSANQQSHRIGPAVFGTIRRQGRDALQYQAAYLFGKAYGVQARMFTMRVQTLF